ncbi:MAG: pilus assembly FimT family protein [Candidatus Methylomirabilales bacterium]
MRAWNRHIGTKGFSLVELFVAITIAGILIGLGLPSFLGLIQRSSINAGTRQVMYEIRAVQNLAVTRGGVFGFHWGGDPLAALPPSQYRIIRDTTGACGFPAPAAPQDGTDVVRTWFDLAGEYPGLTIQSVIDNNATALGGVMFNSRGASVNTCAVPAVTFPVTVTVADNSGVTRTITIQRAGRVTSP